MLISNKYFDKLLKIHNINSVFYYGGDNNSSTNISSDIQTYINDALKRANELFKNVLVANKFGKKISNSLKDAFNGVVGRSNTVKLTYTPIKNGIDLTYGGGFLLFDSTFNFTKVRHLYYNKDKKVINEININTINYINKPISDVLMNTNSATPTIFEITKFVSEFEQK